MAHSALTTRDRGFALVSRLNRWLAAGAVALAGGLSIAAANAFHGHTRGQSTSTTVSHSSAASNNSASSSSSNSTGGSSNSGAGGGSSSGGGLQPPAQAPSSAPAPSGGGVVLGVANSRRLRTKRVPRFVVDAVHRNVSLLAVAFTAVHVITSLLDGFAPITVVDVFIPFTSAYRPLWLGFGAVAFDLLLALVITSLLRRRFGFRLWRLTHWTAYACWPVALLHTFGTGSDVKFGWLLAISAICSALVIAAVLVRSTAGWPSRIGVRLTAILACVAAPLALIVWLPSGPLAKGWAKRAGTPSYLLVSSTRTSGARSTASSGGTPSFTAQVTGTVRQSESSDGQAVVDLSM